MLSRSVRTVSGIVPSYLCPVVIGIVTVNATNHTSLYANLCSLARDQCARSPVCLFA